MAPVAAASGEPVTLRAKQQEKQGDLYKLSGEAEIDFRNLVLRADEITYNADTGEATATGHLTLDGGAHDEHIEASHGSYNVRTETGVLYDVVGTTGVRVRGRRVTLVSSSPFTFSGKKVEKTGPDQYVLYHGWATACELPRPKWTFNAEKIVVNIGGEAQIFNSTFRVEKVPILFFPFAQHPVDTLGRHTGFMVPTGGTSSIKGLVLGDSFYWAINRSADATIGAEYFSKRGWAQHGDFRWRPGEDSYVKLNYFGVMDRGFGPQKIDQGGQDVLLDSETRLPFGFRGVASVEYLSSFLFRLAFTDNFSLTVNSQPTSNVFVSKTYNGFGINALFGRYQNFLSTTPGDVVTINHLPSFEFSSVDRPLGPSPIYWSFDVAAEGLTRKQPGFTTNDVVGRFDLHPQASLPLLWHGWTLRPALAVRETYYGQSQTTSDAVGVPNTNNINRHALEASFELRPPTLGRIFEREVFGRKIKHTIEPRVVYNYVTGVDNFSNIIRFDSRDILSDTNDLEYAVVQRLYSKPAKEQPCELRSATGANGAAGPEQTQGQTPSYVQPPAPAPGATPQSACESRSAREVVAWELKQKYFFDPTFGGALVAGRPNVFTATDNFTGIAFLTQARHFSPVVSRLHIHPSPNTDLGWELDYDTLLARIATSTTFLNVRFGDIFAQAGHAYLLTPGSIATSFLASVPTAAKFNQYRLLLGYGNPNKHGISAAASVGFDANLNFLQYSTLQGSYNWDCCGISFEYRRYVLTTVRNENQYRFAFTLANIGTFGNLKRQERIF